MYSCTEVDHLLSDDESVPVARADSGNVVQSTEDSMRSTGAVL